jgi:hypothetical protein
LTSLLICRHQLDVLYAKQENVKLKKVAQHQEF